jgi:hypothetical protein
MGRALVPAPAQRQGEPQAPDSRDREQAHDRRAHSPEEDIGDHDQDPVKPNARNTMAAIMNRLPTRTMYGF